MTQKVSAVVITYNEAERIEECLRSVAWCDEVIVLDSGSTDGTQVIASRVGARVHEQPFKGYGQQKNDAAALARNNWVLNIDADERVTRELSDSIERCAFSHAAYSFRRDGFFLGRGNRPMHKARVDAPVRLYNRQKCAFTPASVHEFVESNDVGRLDGILVHDSFRNMADQAQRFDKYSSLLVCETPDVRFSVLRLVLRPPGHIIWSLLWQGAWRDGVRGFILASMWGYHDLLVEAKRFERDHYKPSTLWQKAVAARPNVKSRQRDGED